MRRVGQHADALQVLGRVEGQLGVDGRADRQRTDVAQQQRVVVAARLRHEGGADVAVGARTVVDDHRLAQRLAQLLADQAGDDVRRPAGGIGHHQPDRPVRPGIGCQGRRHQSGRGSGEGGGGGELEEAAACLHDVSGTGYLSVVIQQWSPS